MTELELSGLYTENLLIYNDFRLSVLEEMMANPVDFIVI